MKELLEEIEMLFKYFNNGNYLFFIIFLISIIYIFITEKNKKIKDFFVWYSILILIVIWNPICIYFLNKMINMGAMYRIYYMLPNCITIAYTGTKIIERCNKTFYKIIALSVMIGLIITFGNCIFNSNNTALVGNYYKLPDEAVELAYIIGTDSETEYKKAIVPYGVSAQIRQVSPNIEMFYSRIVSNPKDQNGNPLPHDTDDASSYPPVVDINEGNVENVIKTCEMFNINYVIFNKSTKLSDKMENYGFSLYGETLSYSIYRKK